MSSRLLPPTCPLPLHLPSVEKKQTLLSLILLSSTQRNPKTFREELLLNLPKTISAGVKHKYLQGVKLRPIEVSGSPALTSVTVSVFCLSVKRFHVSFFNLFMSIFLAVFA